MDGLIDLTALSGEHRARLAFVPDATAPNGQQLLRVSVYENGTHQATVALDDNNVFVRADEPGPIPEAAAGVGRAVSGGRRAAYTTRFISPRSSRASRRPTSTNWSASSPSSSTAGDRWPGRYRELFHGIPRRTAGEQDRILCMRR